MSRINIITTNNRLPNTCGNCKHTDNDLGAVSLHCDLIPCNEENDWGKVRSWWACQLIPCQYESITFQKEAKE